MWPIDAKVRLQTDLLLLVKVRQQLFARPTYLGAILVHHLTPFKLSKVTRYLWRMRVRELERVEAIRTLDWLIFCLKVT